MATHAEVVKRYVARGIWKEGRAPRYLEGSKIHVSPDGNWIYSFGDHFPMAFYNEETNSYVVNGDRISSTTDRHQRDLRDALTGENIIVPFSTLRLARIHPRDIRVIEYDGEHWDWRCTSPACKITEWQRGQGDWRAHHESSGHHQFSTEKAFFEQRHILGQITFKVRQRYATVPMSYRTWTSVYPTDDISTTYWIGGIDSTARGFGGGYFLSQLPRKIKSIADAYESLKPKTVVQALMDGLDVKRQGDIFGVPVTPPWGDLKIKSMTPNNVPLNESRDFVYYRNGDRPKLLGTNHYAREAVKMDDELYARGTLYHIPGGREADHRAIKLGEDWHLIVRNTAKESFAPMSGGRGRVD